MPNALEVARQRLLLDDLHRSGLSTEVAELRLKEMLECLSYRPGAHGSASTSANPHLLNCPRKINF